MTSRYLKSSTSLIIREMQINATTMSYHLTPVRITIIKQGEGEVAQSCPTLCDPVDCSPPGFSIHGILQARILEWVAISFSRGSSDPGIEPWSPTLEADALTSEPPGKSLGCHQHQAVHAFICVVNKAC